MHIDNYIILLGKEILLQLDLSDRLLQDRREFIFQIFTAICRKLGFWFCVKVSFLFLPCENDSEIGTENIILVSGTSQSSSF